RSDPGSRAPPGWRRRRSAGSRAPPVRHRGHGAAHAPTARPARAPPTPAIPAEVCSLRGDDDPEGFGDLRVELDLHLVGAQGLDRRLDCDLPLVDLEARLSLELLSDVGVGHRAEQPARLARLGVDGDGELAQPGAHLARVMQGLLGAAAGRLLALADLLHHLVVGGHCQSLREQVVAGKARFDLLPLSGVCRPGDLLEEIDLHATSPLRASASSALFFSVSVSSSMVRTLPAEPGSGRSFRPITIAQRSPARTSSSKWLCRSAMSRSCSATTSGGQTAMKTRRATIATASESSSPTSGISSGRSMTGLTTRPSTARTPALGAMGTRGSRTRQ